MQPPDPQIAAIRQAREQFLTLVAEVRPDLHRYCARMTGSVTDGEDVVQDTLARACYMLPELTGVPELRPWLFRVAHNRAMDLLRRHDRRKREPLADDSPLADVELVAADDAIARQQAVAAAVAGFLALPPIPRSCVILKDVLGHSLDEIRTLLELGLPAVKAALHRGRRCLREAAHERITVDAPSPAIARYVALFNARDWEAVRAMLAEDVRLDVVSRAQRRGRADVGKYVDNYSGAHDWHLQPAWLDGSEVIAVLRDGVPAYFIELTLRGEQVEAIRDFRYVPYIGVDAPLRLG
jgi:RNA polymerase sigma factor (sigma-70 family)